MITGISIKNIQRNTREDNKWQKNLIPKNWLDFKELLMSEIIQSEAIINLLDKKGIISKQELLEEMKRVQSKMIKSKS